MSWLLRLRNLMRNLFGTGPTPRDRGASDDSATPAALTLFSGALKLRAGVVSTVGHYREHNEDNYFVPGRASVRFDAPGAGQNNGAPGAGPSPIANVATAPEGTVEESASSFDPSNVVFIVADGMGGQQAGEQASMMAVEIIPKAIARRLAPSVVDPRAVQRLIRDAVAEANQEILGCSGAVAAYSNMGTTVVLALFRNDRVFVAGIGDSRAYRLRDGQLEQMTKDHSLADALEEAGTISKEEVAHHKFKNVLYLYLGSKDARGGPEDVRVLDVLPGDRFLLASDGLTGVVRDDDLARFLKDYDDPQRAARALVDQALANDSKDNITSLVIHVVSEIEQPTL